MRRSIARAALVVLAAMALPSASWAEPSGKCGGGAFAVSSNGGAVCVTSDHYRGSLEVRRTGTATGYVVLDGDSTNARLPTRVLDGYVGVQAGPDYTGPVLGYDGDYAYGPQSPPQPPPVDNPYCDPLACVTVLQGRYVVVFDGAAGNPDPADGFVSVGENGTVCSDDNGSADDGDPSNGPESASPECFAAPTVARVRVLENRYIVVVDGDAGNPDPADGFVSVGNGGTVCTDDNGTADDGDPSNGPESASPTCIP